MRITPILIVALTLIVVACATNTTPPTVSGSTPSDTIVAGDNPATTSPPQEADSPTGGVATDTIVERRIEAYNFGFEPSTITVPVGSRVRLTAFARDGTHGIALPAFGVSTGDFSAGETKTVEFTADKAGEYPFFCNVFCGAGHRDMKGTLIVE